MLFSVNRLPLLLFIRIYPATQPKITAKKNAFCKRLKPSVETSSVMGDPTTGMLVAVAAGAAADEAAGFSSSSDCPGINSACPYSSVHETDESVSPTKNKAYCTESALQFHVDTFFWYFELSALCNGDLLDRLISWSFWNQLDLLDNLVALEDFAKDNVSAVKVARRVLAIEKQVIRSESNYLGVEVVMKNWDPLVS